MFFVTTILSVIFMNGELCWTFLELITLVICNNGSLILAFCTLFQCGLLGIIGKFPHSYTTATMSGESFS